MAHKQRREAVMQSIDNLDNEPQGCDIIELESRWHGRDSLSDDFYNELDAWARQALAANGFSDY
jgi:hypothetical protein